MNSKFLREVIEYFLPLEIIILLFIFGYITLTKILIGYLLYCIFIYFTSKTYLFYIKTEFNSEIIDNCPSIKKANFKQYFLLPFTFCQFILFQITNKKRAKNRKRKYFLKKKK